MILFTIICIVLALFNQKIDMSSIWSIEHCYKIRTYYLIPHIGKDMHTQRFTLTEHVFWLQFALVSFPLFCSAIKYFVSILLYSSARELDIIKIS